MDLGVPKCKKEGQMHTRRWSFPFFSLITDPNIVKFRTIVKVSKKAFRFRVARLLTLPGLKVIAV